MTTLPPERSPGHAFISYVRQDAAYVDRLQAALTAVGIEVWRDTESLWPGQDWEIQIRRAITENSLVFIACFSENSERREVSYQREELALAVDQMRRRSPGVSWLIPVRFSECRVPEYNLGAGRTLNSLQRLDLFGDDWDRSIARLTVTVVRMLEGMSHQDFGTTASVATTARDSGVEAIVKATLPNPERRIELDTIVTDVTRSVAVSLQDETALPTIFPESVDSSMEGRARYLAKQARLYERLVQPLTEVLVPGSLWGESTHEALWTRCVQRVANARGDLSGNSALLNLQRYPIMYLLYVGGIGALYSKNYGAIRSTAIDAQLRTHEGRVAVVAKVHPWLIFEGQDLAANIITREDSGEPLSELTVANLISGTEGKRFTPVSDHLYHSVRSLYADVIPDDFEFTEVFDSLEVLFGLLVADQKAFSNAHVAGPWIGSFVWRDRYSREDKHVEERFVADLLNDGGNSAALRSGLFDGNMDRAVKASRLFTEQVANARERGLWR